MRRILPAAILVFACSKASAQTTEPTTKPTTQPVIPTLMKESATSASVSTSVFSPPTLTKPLPGQTSGNPYSVTRTNENYDALLDPANRHDLFDPIKRIPISATDPSYYISFGGEVRERYELFNNFNF